MPVEYATPAELYIVTPGDLLVTYLVGLGVALVAAALALWVFWPSADPEPPTPREVDSREAEETVPLPPRNRVHGPRTGSLHGPVHHRPDMADAPTQTIERVVR